MLRLWSVICWGMLFSVSNGGVLWAYSCFAFEGMNHTIRKMFHGTQDAGKEVWWSLTWDCTTCDHYLNLACFQPYPTSNFGISDLDSSCQSKVQVLLKKLRGNSRWLFFMYMYSVYNILVCVWVGRWVYVCIVHLCAVPLVGNLDWMPVLKILWLKCHGHRWSYCAYSIIRCVWEREEWEWGLLACMNWV